MPKQKPELIKRLLRESMKGRTWLYVSILVTALAIAGLTALQSYSTKLIVNGVFGADAQYAPASIALFVITVFFGKSVFLYTNSVLSTLFGRSVSAHYQKRSFESALEKNVGFFTTHSANQMAKTMMFGRAAGAAVRAISNKMVVDLTTLIALSIVMITQAPRLSMLAIVVLPFIYLVVSRLSAAVRNATQSEAKMDGALFAVGAETFEGIKTIKSFGLETKSQQKFGDAVEMLQRRLLKIAKITGATIPLVELVGGLSLVAFVLYVATFALNDGMDAGSYAAFLTAFLMAYQPAQRLSATWVKLQRSMLLVGQMFALFSIPADFKKDNPNLRNLDSSIRLENVSYSYAEQVTLDDISVDIPARSRVALVGPSGAGKTTLTDLLLRFYAPSGGRIYLGEHPLDEFGTKQLEEHICLVTQHPFLFDGSIRENILDGNNDISAQSLEEICDFCGVSQFTSDLENGLETAVGPNGTMLSGGQRQRVALARSIAKNAKIYIFDEATSALDPLVEQLVLTKIVQRLSDATIIFVTHREAVVDYMEQILLLNAGKIIDYGDAAVVAARSDTFKTIFG